VAAQRGSSYRERRRVAGRDFGGETASGPGALLKKTFPESGPWKVFHHEIVYCTACSIPFS
jgi:hypothetical protein